MEPVTRTNATNSHLWDLELREHSETGHKEPTYPIFFIFFVAAVGALLRVILMNAPCKIFREFPYTVLMVLMGVLAGVINEKYEGMDKFMKTAQLNAHALLMIFLPCLIFSSAFEMEMHIFYKSVYQVMILAGPGTLIATGLTATMIWMIWDWQILCALLFGSIVSATDPVAVVSILHSCGAPSRLGVLIDGEALINDGAAIVLFTIFSNYERYQGFMGFMFFCLVIFLSPVAGYGVGKVAGLCISKCYNDVITETIITIALPFILYVVAEKILSVSGVLTVLVFGLTLAHHKTAFSPKVYPVLMHIWEYITFLANTLIFFIVGLVMRLRFSEMKEKPAALVGEMFVVYILVVAIRLIVIVVLYPFLKRSGYGINWRIALVLLWGGLRGAVGLALALVVVELSEENIYWHGKNHEQYEEKKTRATKDKIMMYTCGIVFLTLIINATTTSALLKALDFGKASIAKKINMTSALKKIEEKMHGMMAIMTSDKFLAGANWQYVQGITTFNHMYKDSDEEEHDDIFLDRKTTCPDCSTRVQNNPSVNETKDMLEEARHRMLRLEGVSYLTQYGDGRILQGTTHELHSRTEELAETEEGYTNVDGVVNEHVTAQNLYAKRGIKIRRRKKLPTKQLDIHIKNANQEFEADDFKVSTVDSDSTMEEEISIIAPEKTKSQQCRGKLRLIVDSLPFEIFFLILIVANMVPICMEIPKPCSSWPFFYADLGFLLLYTIEFVMRMGGHGKDYLPRSLWGFLDLIIIVMAVVTSLGTLLQPNWEGTQECKDSMNETSSKKSNSIRWIKALKICRIVRIIRLARFFMSEDSNIVQNMINSSYNAVMEVNAAIITAQDEIRANISQVPISVYKPISDITKARIQANRFISKMRFAKLSMERPGVEISLKTRQATAVVVGSAIQRVDELYEMGFLEDKDWEALFCLLEKKKINSNKMPNSLDIPDANLALSIVPWMDGDEDVQNFVTSKATLLEFEKGANMNVGSYRGIYIIVSGSVLIKGVRGLRRLQAEHWSGGEGDRALRPDMSGKWQDTLPKHLLARLAKPKGAMMAVTHDSVGMEDIRDQMLNSKFTIVSRGFVLNEINAVAGSELGSTPRALCLSNVIAYHLTADKVKEMLAQFSCRFHSLEASIWVSLANRYFVDEKRQDDWSNLDTAYVIFIDGNHKLKSSEKVEFQIDYASVQHAMLLKGQARSSALEETVTGPYEMHHGELSLEFTPPSGIVSRSDEVLGVIFVVPNSGNDVYEVFSPDLETIREYAADWLKTEGFAGSSDELILRSIKHFDNSPGGPDEDSPLFISMKNRISQVIKAYSAIHGKTLTPEQVILDDNLRMKRTKSALNIMESKKSNKSLKLK